MRLLKGANRGRVWCLGDASWAGVLGQRPWKPRDSASSARPPPLPLPRPREDIADAKERAAAEEAANKESQRKAMGRVTKESAQVRPCHPRCCSGADQGLPGHRRAHGTPHLSLPLARSTHAAPGHAPLPPQPLGVALQQFTLARRPSSLQLPLVAPSPTHSTLHPPPTLAPHPTPIRRLLRPSSRWPTP
jgi:hypothetical protein